MQLGIPAYTPAVLEQPRVVGGDALEERFDRALDLDVAHRGVTEHGAIMDQRADQVEDQLDVDIAAQVSSRVSPLEGLPDGRARRVEERGHEGRPQLAVGGAVGEERTDHAGRHAPKGGDEYLEALVEI